MSTPSARPRPVREAGVRELTFGQAINEALREELRRDPAVFVIGEDVAEAGTPFKVLLGLVDEFGPRPRDRLADLGGRHHRDRRRRRDDRDAPGGRHHVRGLPDARDGSAREPGRQGALHVRRRAARADGAAHDARRHTPLGGPAQPEPARLGQPHPGPQGRAARHAVRRQGPAQGRDPRRQPGRLLRGQARLRDARAGARGGVRDPASASRTSSARAPT